MLSSAGECSTAERRVLLLPMQHRRQRKLDTGFDRGCWQMWGFCPDGSAQPRARQNIASNPCNWANLPGVGHDGIDAWCAAAQSQYAARDPPARADQRSVRHVTRAIFRREPATAAPSGRHVSMTCRCPWAFFRFRQRRLFYRYIHVQFSPRRRAAFSRGAWCA